MKKAPRAILHAHNLKFAAVEAWLPELQTARFDAVQISPAQRSPAGDAWYLRYQPVDYLTIDGLGSADDLARLCSSAHACGMRVIGDVVFNHMAVPRGTDRSAWLAAHTELAAGRPEPMAQLRSRLDEFPHLSAEDFQPWRDMQGEDWDNEHRYESWGAGEWPELRPTENVLQLQAQHLRLLYDAGVRGFRFDAVKHMRPAHLESLMATINEFAEPCWCYGEVLSTDKGMQAEYQHLFPTSDFTFITHLRDRLASGLPFTVDAKELFHSADSIRFGVNHDTECNPPELMGGLLFASPEHRTLARCLASLLAGGTNLIFGADLEPKELLFACVGHKATHGGLSGPVTVQEIPAGFEVASSTQRVVLDLAKGCLAEI